MPNCRLEVITKVNWHYLLGVLVVIESVTMKLHQQGKKNTHTRIRAPQHGFSGACVANGPFRRRQFGSQAGLRETTIDINITS